MLSQGTETLQTRLSRTTGSAQSIIRRSMIHDALRTIRMCAPTLGNATIRSSLNSMNAALKRTWHELVYALVLERVKV
jgi:hypothetical protein